METATIAAWQDRLFLERVERARRMSPAEKWRAGADLFEEACRWTLGGIRRLHPTWSETEVHTELQRRLQWADRLALRP